MKTKITLHFYAKKSKANVAGLLPIYVRLTVNGERLEFSSKKFIEKSKWSEELAKMKGHSEEARSINSYLDSVKAQVTNIEIGLTHKKENLNIESFRKILFGNEERARMVMPIYKEHNDRIASLIGKGYALGTLERFKISMKHLSEFLFWKFEKRDIAIDKIDFALITDFEFYLRSVKNCNNNTSVKYVRNFRKIIKICLSNDWLEKDPFVKYNGIMKEVETEFLTHEEINNIYSKKFRTSRLELVRDIFIFCCYTGLAYVDVKGLNQNHIGLGIDGQKWIFKNRQKTNTKSKIPLLAIPEEIIKKYATHPKCLNEDRVLPVLSNQKMNGYLKEIGDLCEITKDITFHMARHTFATSVTLANGVPIESVGKMLGHKNITTTQHYARVLDKKVSDDMQLLRDKLSNSESNFKVMG